MGYDLPHQTQSANKISSFVKPDVEVEYLATHVLSNLPREVDGDDWSMDFLVYSMCNLGDDIELVPRARRNYLLKLDHLLQQYA